MARRISNNHTIPKGVFKHGGVKQPSRTTSRPARLYFAYPPAEGWPGGMPEKNGYKAGGGK